MMLKSRKFVKKKKVQECIENKEHSQNGQDLTLIY